MCHSKLCDHNRKGYTRHFWNMDPLNVSRENIYKKETPMEMKIGVDTIRQVFAPDYDWSVLYFDNRKIWEGHDCNSRPNQAIAEALGAKFYMYEFTDENEIDGCTPFSFMHINGIKEI